jgi:hypothetical protein
MLHSLFYLTITLRVSGIIITHLQEHKTTVTTSSGNRYHRTAVCCYRGKGGTEKISSNSSTIAIDNNMGTYILHYSIERIAFSAEYTLSTTIVILI